MSPIMCAFMISLDFYGSEVSYSNHPHTGKTHLKLPLS